MQPIRTGFPYFAAALAGYVEATRVADVERTGCSRRRHNTLADSAMMNVLGARAAMSFGSEADKKAWADHFAPHPARIPPATPGRRRSTTPGTICRLTWGPDWPGLLS